MPFAVVTKGYPARRPIEERVFYHVNAEGYNILKRLRVAACKRFLPTFDRQQKWEK